MKVACFAIVAFLAQALASPFVPSLVSRATPPSDGPFQASLTQAQIASIAAAQHKGPHTMAGQYLAVYFNDTSLRYIGHWDKKSYVPNFYASWYGAAQIKTIFTGSSFFIALANTNTTTTDFYVTIGSQSAFINGAYGLVNVSQYIPFSASGSKSVTVYTQSASDVTLFEGFVIDYGSTTTFPAAAKYLFEWVGDSITAGYITPNPAEDSYAFLTSQKFGADYADIAFPGICLVDLSNCFNNEGMETIYFETQPPGATSYTPWDFTQYNTTHIMINLGTNDNVRITGPQFQPHLTSFVQNIRKQWPAAHIFVIRPFGFSSNGGPITPIYSNETLASVQAVNAAGDKNVYWVNTTNWVVPSDLADGIHPTVAGHIKIAGLLETALQKIATANKFAL